MAEDQTYLYLLVIVALVAVLGLGLAAASLATNESVGRMMGAGGGNMMGSPGGAGVTSTPGVFEWTILVVSMAALVLAVGLLIRGRHPQAPTEPRREAPSFPGGGSLEPVQARDPALAVPPPAAPVPAVPEPALVKLLDADEKRMYLELRDHGGQMFQRDLVALGVFSKAKVTRVLDKLEAKGLVVREAHGMTNRVRLVNLSPR
ncbi:MAG TPA: MarR family transcriptional regulator [Thermoplasmata archaeon]|nr:MarR family transcriptional regulator [Thermoplasmata archaeon]